MDQKKILNYIKKTKSQKILIVGIAYKRNVNDDERVSS